MSHPYTHEATPGPHEKWLEENPGELPHEVRDAADSMGGRDLPDEVLRDLIEMDPDLLGDWDAFQ